MSDPILLVVKRGALRRYDALRRKTANLNVEVIWDRREGARRQETRPTDANRRRGDRRGPDDSLMWSAADFTVAAAAPRKK
jgi:hypothetical protein